MKTDFLDWINTSIKLDKQNNYSIQIGSQIYTADVYFPDQHTAIDYIDVEKDGEFFGNKPKKFYSTKRVVFKNSNIHLVQVYSIEWAQKKTIIQNKLIHILGTGTHKKVHARETEIREIDTESARVFLEQMHIQGFTGSLTYIGAYSDTQLVAIMSFGCPRIIHKNKIVADGTVELVRFSIDNSMSIPGLFAKMLKWYIENYHPVKIYSYANLRYTNELSNVYEKNGFMLDISATKDPNYNYAKEGKIYHRSKFMKAKIAKMWPECAGMTESEAMKAKGYERIWDCGNLKYLLSV